MASEAKSSALTPSALVVKQFEHELEFIKVEKEMAKMKLAEKKKGRRGVITQENLDDKFEAAGKEIAALAKKDKIVKWSTDRKYVCDAVEKFIHEKFCDGKKGVLCMRSKAEIPNRKHRAYIHWLEIHFNYDPNASDVDSGSEEEEGVTHKKESPKAKKTKQ